MRESNHSAWAPEWQAPTTWRELVVVLKQVAKRLLDYLPLEYVPVRVRGGLAKGARWTLYPYSSYWRGQTESDVETALRLHGAVRGAACWDLGAHFGIHSVGMAMAVGPTGEVAAFEPDPIAFRRCSRHVEMNSLAWVRLHNAAVSDTSGMGALLQSQGAGASTSHFAYEDEQADSAVARVVVPMVRLDDLVDRGAIRIPRFIKVDVEGHGAAALRGAAKALSRALPAIVMSFHSRWEVEGTREVLEPLGYRSFNCDGRPLGWTEILFRTALLRI